MENKSGSNCKVAVKPHRGELWNVLFHKYDRPGWDGYLGGQLTVRLYATGWKNPDLIKVGNMWRTSLIVRLEGDTIETLNSVYRIMSFSEN